MTKYPQDKLSFKILQKLASNKITLFIPVIWYCVVTTISEWRYQYRMRKVRS